MEIFHKIDGCDMGKEIVIFGNRNEFNLVIKHILDVYESNKRKKTLISLSEVFCASASGFIRLNLKQGQLLCDVYKTKQELEGEKKPCKYGKFFLENLWVY